MWLAATVSPPGCELWGPGVYIEATYGVFNTLVCCVCVPFSVCDGCPTFINTSAQYLSGWGGGVWALDWGLGHGVLPCVPCGCRQRGCSVRDTWLSALAYQPQPSVTSRLAPVSQYSCHLARSIRQGVARVKQYPLASDACCSPSPTHSPQPIFNAISCLYYTSIYPCVCSIRHKLSTSTTLH